MTTLSQTDRLHDSFEALQPRAAALADRFYQHLFKRQPVLRAVLPRDQWQRSADLVSALEVLIRHHDSLDAIQHTLMDLGARAQRLGVMPQQYGMARQALIDAMRDVLGAAWTEDLESAWTNALNAAASVVVLGAGRSRARAA